MSQTPESEHLKTLEAKFADRTRELSEAYAFLDSVIENIPNMIFVKDAGSLNFVRFNKAGEDLLGVSRKDLLGKNDHDLFPADQAQAFIAADRDVIARRNVVDIPQEPITTRRLGLRTLHTKKIPIYDEKGEPRYLVGISEDITEYRRLQQEQMQLIEERITKAENERVTERFKFLSRASALLGSSLDFEKTLSHLTYLAIPDFADWCAIQLLDANGELTQLAVANRDPEKVKWGQKFYQDYPPEAESETGPMAVIRMGKSEMYNNITDEMISAAAKSPEHLVVLNALDLHSYLCAPIRIYDRVIGTLTLVSTRESGRIYTEQDLLLAEELGERAGFAVENARLYKESRQLNRVKDEFLATLSHELRTPLNVIQGHAEILKSEFSNLSPSEFAGSIDAILRNAQTQMTIVSDLLDASSIITGKVSFKPVYLAPGEIIRSTVKGLSPSAEAKNVHLTYDVTDAPPKAYSDPARLQQIIFNLISNAIKFTPAQGSVKVRCGSSSNDWWLTVEDSGSGIDPAFLPFVFERFRQEDSSASRRHGGLGLGLSIVRNLVELHGGSVSVRSDGSGQGSCFKIVLPISGKRSSESPATVPTQLKAAEPIEPADLRELQILLVEDSADNRFLIERVLSMYGAKTIQAESAPRARELLETLTPDLIISDIGMPGENGLEFMRRLRGNVSSDKVPAIALTAYVREEEKQAALDAGFQAHVGKPVTAIELLTAISTVLRGPKHTRPRAT